jgi:hypothetical protein
MYYTRCMKKLVELKGRITFFSTPRQIRAGYGTLYQSLQLRGKMIKDYI